MVQYVQIASEAAKKTYDFRKLGNSWNSQLYGIISHATAVLLLF